MKTLVSVLIVTLSLSIAFNATAKNAKPEYDQNVTPDVIFGAGNANGAFTTVRQGGIELGLRAKQRFPKDNIFNSNGDGTYSFPAGDACPGFGFSPFPLCLTTPIWNFEWSVNTDFAGDTGQLLWNFAYEISLDSDPGKKTNYTVFDNITPSLAAPMFDHAIGDNFTPNGGGDTATGPLNYQTLLDSENVAQNSWNYEFFNNLGTSLEYFDPAVPGQYTVRLRAKDLVKGKTVAEVTIDILTSTP